MAAGVSDGHTPAVGVLNGYAAALIGPHTVVTACHVVRHLRPAQITWRPGRAGARSYRATRVTCHNKGTDVNNVATYDIATVELEAPVVEAAPLGITSELPPSNTLVEVWGTGGKNRDNPALPATRTRQRSSFSFILNSARDGPEERTVCPGDSGGPYVWNGKVFAVVHDWHHDTTGFDTFARIPQGW